jgi:hypothetical protein
MKTGERERSEKKGQFWKFSWTGEGFIRVRQAKQHFHNFIVTGEESWVVNLLAPEFYI